jgi:hypothetical protein
MLSKISHVWLELDNDFVHLSHPLRLDYEILDFILAWRVDYNLQINSIDPDADEEVNHARK